VARKRPFDELWGGSGGRAARAGFEPLGRWIGDTGAAELARRQQAAEAAFRTLGVTFSVYGEKDSTERIIPFDIIPRIFTAREWERVSAGLEQRVRAINAFIADVYGERRILADGIVPADIVLGNPQFCIPVAGARPPHGVYAHISGIDLVRTGADEFVVLEDNVRTPSGVSYMIENREAMLRLCPELFDAFAVQPVDNYPDLLRDTLYSVAPRGARDPVCVLLTPGHHNSAFYEHSFLADNMGIELVEGSTTISSIRSSSTRIPCSACPACSPPISPATSPSSTRPATASPTTRRSIPTCPRSSVIIRAVSRCCPMSRPGAAASPARCATCSTISKAWW
jgi:uncharacterized circularly permuted ATP-grasp superfamily protein